MARRRLYAYNTVMDIKVVQKINAYFTKFKHQAYKKGEILVRADDNPFGIFYLKSGVVKEYVISKGGNELVLNIYKAISFFPMSWAINNAPNRYYYEALTDAEIYRAPREKTLEFIKKNPDVLYDLVSRVFVGTEGLLMRMAYLMSGNAYARLVAELIIHAKRFGKKTKEGIEITASERELASHIGIARETVNREMRILKEKKLASCRKNILIIKDIEKLEEELSSNF